MSWVVECRDCDWASTAPDMSAAETDMKWHHSQTEHHVEVVGPA